MKSNIMAACKALGLAKLQSEFQHYLMQSNIQSILPCIAPDTRFSAPNRLKVYHDAYRFRLLEILQLDFPKTHMLLGDEKFETAFFQYLSKHPSQHFSVRYFGQHFTEFLSLTAPFSEQPVLAEMALFEWSIAFTIDAGDALITHKDRLLAISPELWPELHFTLHTSVLSHYFHWDTPQLWQHIENEQPPRSPVKLSEPVRWIFWRKGIRSYFQSCNLAEDKMFIALLNGCDFGEMCESLLDILPEEEIPPIAAQTLFKWINEEMISEIG